MSGTWDARGSSFVGRRKVHRICNFNFHFDFDFHRAYLLSLYLIKKAAQKSAAFSFCIGEKSVTILRLLGSTHQFLDQWCENEECDPGYYTIQCQLLVPGRI